MSAELRITDSCPSCGQLVMFALPALAPQGSDPYIGLAVLVAPQDAQLTTVDPADHPCPGQPTDSVHAVPEDHAS
jgi:hypothetical protein